MDNREVDRCFQCFFTIEHEMIFLGQVPFERKV